MFRFKMSNTIIHNQTFETMTAKLKSLPTTLRGEGGNAHIKKDLCSKLKLILRDQAWFNSSTTLAIKALRAAAWVSGAILLTIRVEIDP